MYREEEVEEALEFCRDIERFYNNRGSEENPYESWKELRSREPWGSAPALAGEEDADPETPCRDSASRASRFLIELFFCMLTAFAFSYLFTGYVGQHTRVDGSSMENTLHNGDYLVIDKLTYRFTEPKRFDIIVFPFEENVYYIKRIIGLPGETVRIDGADILINGEKLSEGYGREPIHFAGAAGAMITLGADEYFVLGDNRNHSMDSRYSEVGNIRRENIMGRAFLRIYPFSSFGLLKHG